MATVFLFCMVVGLTARPAGWHKLLVEPHTFYDAANYIRIAIKGYEDPTLMAFYPLWPAILKGFGTLLDLQSPYQYGVLGVVLATLLFGASVYILSRHLLYYGDSVASKFAMWIYVLAPVSIFHIIGYTESLAALLIALLFRGLQRHYPCSWLFFLSFLICLTRPLSYFIVPAAVLSWLGTDFISHLKTQDGNRSRVRQLLAIAMGSAVSHLGYMYVQWRVVGNAFATTKAQNTWGRELGLHWDLIVHPRVVGGSDQVLHIDMLAFYGPALLLLVAFFRRWIPRQQALLFWFAGLVPVGLAGVQFLTYDLFASLARHVFALPFFVIALAIVLQDRLPSLRWRQFILVIWALFLVRWWVRFGEGAWIG